MPSVERDAIQCKTHSVGRPRFVAVALLTRAWLEFIYKFSRHLRAQPPHDAYTPMMTAPILYLDFDGVLHPADVRVTRDEPLCPKVYVRDQVTEEPLFRYMPLLELLLTPHPDLRIVLSTSWVRTFGYEFSVNQLSPNLRTRVIGAATFPALTRFDAIDIDAEERGLTSWLALDDDMRGWPDARRHQIVAPSSSVLGLSQPGVAAELARRLEALCSVEPLELMVGATARQRQRQLSSS